MSRLKQNLPIIYTSDGKRIKLKVTNDISKLKPWTVWIPKLRKMRKPMDFIKYY